MQKRLCVQSHARPRYRTNDRGTRMEAERLALCLDDAADSDIRVMVTDTVAVAAAVGVPPCDLAGGNLPVQDASSGVPFL